MSERPASREAQLIEFLHAIDVPAPARLRHATERLIEGHAHGASAAHPRSGGTAGRRVALAPRLGALGALAATILAVVLVVSLGGSGGHARALPAEVAALALRSSTSGPPAESRRQRDQLVATVDGLAFPYWGERFGWRSSGSRTDSIGGRTVSTVFYTDNASQRIGYAIVAGAAPTLTAGTVVLRAGHPYRVIDEGHNRTVVWIRAGHLCVVAGAGVSSATLVKLASWDDRGAPA